MLRLYSEMGKPLAGHQERRSPGPLSGSKMCSGTYSWGKATKPKRSFSFAALRITELRRLLQHRYGHTLPNDAAGRDAALVMAHHKARLGNNPRRGIHHFFELSCPWMTKADMSTMANAVMRKSLKWSADKLAARLQITETERREAGRTQGAQPRTTSCTTQGQGCQASRRL